MVKKMAYIVVGIFALVLAWMGASFLTERGVQEPSYALEKAMDGYEIRRYEPYLVAEVEVPASTEDPLGVGFRTLFKYIDGANKGRRKIDMTSPVLRQEPKAEKIPMTKPVFGLKKQGATKVGFVLPKSFTLETAPLPEDQDIRIRETPARRVAVIVFSGYATNTLMDQKRKELISLLDRDGLQPVGASLTAYYNPPWTPPFMRRNEVMFAIK